MEIRMSNITSVSIPAQREIQAANSSIAQIRDFQSKNWAIGLNGDTLAPDGFLAFFTERHLPFSYYVRAKGVNVGEPSAYQTSPRSHSTLATSGLRKLRP
jgi:hypothetical protein